MRGEGAEAGPLPSPVELPIASQPPSIRSSRPLVLLLALNVLAASWVATQVVAHQLAYQRNLGSTLFAAPGTSARWLLGASILLTLAAIGYTVRARRMSWLGLLLLSAALLAGALSDGPLYAPHRYAVWRVLFRNVAPLVPALHAGEVAGAAALVAFVCLSLGAYQHVHMPTASGAFGTARWGTGEVFRHAHGVWIGRSLAPPGVGEVYRYTGDGHIITIAPTRSGKGVGLVLPNLLMYDGSVFVTDLKGENYAVTARRRRELGHTVHALDPFGVVGAQDAYNPLDLLDPASDDVGDDAAMLGDMLVVRGLGPNGDAFWDDEAAALLSGLILYVATSAPPELRTLPHMRALLTLPPDQFAAALDNMLASTAAGGLVARAAARLLQKADRERSGVISAAQRYTHFLDSPRMGRVMGQSTVDLKALKEGRTTVYVVLPPDRLDTYRGWLRLMIACALTNVTRTRGHAPRRVLFLLDEFANLGAMAPIERGVTLAAGYGATFWMLLQDLAQLKGTYRKTWLSFIANTDVLQAFGTADMETAEHLSKMTGDATIHVASENVSQSVSHGRGASRQQSAAHTRSERGRRLLLPDEVLRLPRTEQLLFVRGHHPIRARCLNYLRDPEFVGLADDNPMHAPLTEDP